MYSWMRVTLGLTVFMEFSTYHRESKLVVDRSQLQRICRIHYGKEEEPWNSLLDIGKRDLA